MTPRKALMASLLLLAGTAMTGCASLESEAPPDWRSAVEVRPLAEAEIVPDRTRIVLGNPRQAAVVDGYSGEPVGVIGDDARLNVTISIGGTAAYRLRADSSNTVTLPEAGLVLIMDYAGTSERLTAMDVDTGRLAWHTDAFSYSIQQYEQLIRSAASAAGKTLASLLGGSARGESIVERRQRQRAFARHLTVEVDGGDAILFKTFGGLYKLDAATGEPLWRLPDFQGPGLQQVTTLPNGDYLVLATGLDLSKLQAADAYHLARITADGQLRWMTEHAGRDTAGLYTANDRVLVDGSPLQVFDLKTGDRLWENGIRRSARKHPDPRHIPQPPPLATGDMIVQAAPITGEAGRTISTGFPHRVRAYDADTGDVLWETTETNTFFGEIHLEGDRLLVWGAGEFFGEKAGGGMAALDLHSGETLWRTAAMATPGTVSKSDWVVEPVFDHSREQVFIAGPEDLIGVRIADGTQTLSIDLSETDLGDTVGLSRHGDDVIVVGQSGVAAYDMNDSTQRFETQTERVVGFTHRGNRVILNLVANALADLSRQAPDVRGLRAVDLRSGRPGSLVAWEPGTTLLFGGLSRGGALISEDGRFAYVVDKDRRLTRYSL